MLINVCQHYVIIQSCCMAYFLARLIVVYACGCLPFQEQSYTKSVLKRRVGKYVSTPILVMVPPNLQKTKVCQAVSGALQILME